MKFLADTNVLSEARHPLGDASVKQRLRAVGSVDLCTSAIVFGELAKGVAMLPAGRRKEAMSLWLDGIEDQFGDRILPFDQAVAKLWGQLTARGSAAGHQIAAIDGQIAATALHHKFTVVTRNDRGFEPAGVPTWNPWESEAP